MLNAAENHLQLLFLHRQAGSEFVELDVESTFVLFQLHFFENAVGIYACTRSKLCSALRAQGFDFTMQISVFVQFIDE